MTVVSLAEVKNAVEPEVVAMLKDALAAAERGELSGVVMVIAERDAGMSTYGFAGRVCNLGMMGATTLAIMRLRELIEEGVEPELIPK